MISEPASKQWFEKHGLPGKKQEMAKKMDSKGAVPKIKGSAAWNKYHNPEKYHAEAEKGRAKMHEHMAKGQNMGNNPSEKFKADHQKRTGRAYSE